MQRLQFGALADWLPRASAQQFDETVYRELGYFIVRDVIPPEQIARWQALWSEFYATSLRDQRHVDPFNPVHVHERAPEELENIHQNDALLDVMETLYPDLAIYMQRFVIKTHDSRNPVFVHSDFAYDYGWPEKTTVFLPLSPSNEETGGISFYPGTHHFGYLGDAGEANPDILEPEWPLVCPDINPGDIALCHTCTWHCSPPHRSGPDRILVQMTFQPASDPSSTALLRGQWRTRYRLAEVDRGQFFRRSRSSRLRELQAQVDGRTP